MKKSEIDRELLKEKYDFKEANHFTITKTLSKFIGRNRVLVFGNLGTPNEMLFIEEINDESNPTKVEDLICLHNFDYDGFMTYSKLELLLKFFNTKNKQK